MDTCLRRYDKIVFFSGALGSNLITQLTYRLRCALTNDGTLVPIDIGLQNQNDPVE